MATVAIASALLSLSTIHSFRFLIVKYFLKLKRCEQFCSNAPSRTDRCYGRFYRNFCIEYFLCHLSGRLINFMTQFCDEPSAQFKINSSTAHMIQPFQTAIIITHCFYLIVLQIFTVYAIVKGDMMDINADNGNGNK